MLEIIKKGTSVMAALVIATAMLSAPTVKADPIVGVGQEVCPQEAPWVKEDGLSGLSYTYIPGPGFMVTDNCYKAGTTVNYGMGATVTSTVWNKDDCESDNPPDGCNYQELSHASFKLVPIEVEEPEFYLEFEKVWDGDEVDLEGVEVVFVNSEGQEAEPGDVVSGDDIYPGATVDGLTEVVTGFPEDCTFTNDIQESYVLFEDLVSAELRAVVTDVPTNGEMSYTDTITVTNTVECDEEDDPVTPFVPEGETEVPPTTTTPVSTTTTTTATTTQQVTATPVGAVDAGAGSALTALVGLFGSTGLVSVGAFLRRFSL